MRHSKAIAALDGHIVNTGKDAQIIRVRHNCNTMGGRRQFKSEKRYGLATDRKGAMAVQRQCALPFPDHQSSGSVRPAEAAA